MVKHFNVLNNLFHTDSNSPYNQQRLLLFSTYVYYDFFPNNFLGVSVLNRL